MDSSKFLFHINLLVRRYSACGFKYVVKGTDQFNTEILHKSTELAREMHSTRPNLLSTTNEISRKTNKIQF